MKKNIFLFMLFSIGFIWAVTGFSNVYAYEISKTSYSAGTIDIISEADEGDNVSIKVTPNEGKIIEKVFVVPTNENGELGGICADGPCSYYNDKTNKINFSFNYNTGMGTFTMPKHNVRILVSFVDENDHQADKITIENDSFGLIQPYVNKGINYSPNENQEVNLVMSDFTGYALADLIFYKWNGSEYVIDETIDIDISEDFDGFIADTYKFNMPNYKIKIKAVTVKHDISFSISSPKHGTIQMRENAGYGEYVKIKAVPDQGYKLKEINVENTPLDAPIIKLPFDMDTMTFRAGGILLFDFSVRATFEGIENNITTMSENGMVNIPSKAKTGEEVTISNIVADEGYEFDSIKIYKTGDKNTTVAVSDNKFVMPSFPVTVEVLFKPVSNTYKIIKTNFTNVHYYITDENYNEKTEFEAGETVYLNCDEICIDCYLKTFNIINANTNKKLNISYNYSDGVYSFVMPSANINLNISYVYSTNAPTTVSAKLYGYDDVKFTWSRVSSAEGYIIKYKKSTSTSWSTWNGTKYTSSNYRYVKIPNLADGVKYNFRVYTYVTDIQGVKHYKYKTYNIYTLKKMATPKITKISSSRVRISYTKINGATGYQISQSTIKTGTRIVSKITVKKNKKYYYKVRAYKTVDGKKIYGPWSYVRAYTLK